MLRACGSAIVHTPTLSVPESVCAWVASRPVTASHPNSEVKLDRVQVILRWGTTREGWMLHMTYVLFDRIWCRCSLSSFSLPLALSFSLL